MRIQLPLQQGQGPVQQAEGSILPAPLMTSLAAICRAICRREPPPPPCPDYPHLQAKSEQTRYNDSANHARVRVQIFFIIIAGVSALRQRVRPESAARGPYHQ